MKPFKFLSLAVLVLSAGVFLPGCKKDDPVQNCKIITITPSTGDGYNFTYNNSRKPETLTYGKMITVFSYSGNVITANSTLNGAFNKKEIITINTNGLATNVKTETNANGSAWYNHSYEYNGTELIKDTYTNSQNIVPQISVVTWSGGNLVTITQNGVTSTLEYYSDKLSQTGDYLDIAQMIQGYRIYNTKNAIKSLNTNSIITSFDYTYQDGKISVLKVNNNGSIVNYNYQYQCN